VALEGVYSARIELEDLVDISVLVQVDEAVRLSRLAARHDPLPIAERWEAAENYYFEHLRPPGEFALIVSGR
jgi:uridine kinase